MRAIGIACCTFLIVSLSGYTVYGEEVASDILVSFPQVRTRTLPLLRLLQPTSLCRALALALMTCCCP